MFKPHGPASLVVAGILLSLTNFAPPVQSQSAAPFAYPSHQQSLEQQQQDHYACYVWAKQQTGVDPTQISVSNSAPPSPQGGAVLRGAGRGALLGTVGGAIGGDVGEGAAIGAGVGALAGIIRRHEEQREVSQAQAQASAQAHQNLQRYYQAWGTCMKGRGYTVS